MTKRSKPADEKPAPRADKAVDKAPTAHTTTIGDGTTSRYRVQHPYRTTKIDVAVTKNVSGRVVPVPVHTDGDTAVVVDFGGKPVGVDTFTVTIRKS